MRRQAGFTLVEMMVVIVIIGILAAVLVTQISGRADKARAEATKAMIAQLSGALDMFKLDFNRYPDRLEDLLNMPSYADAKKWPPGGYIKNPPKDAWGNEFVYRVPGTGGHPFDIISLGEDAREGGEGYAEDLANHQMGGR